MGRNKKSWEYPLSVGVAWCQTPILKPEKIPKFGVRPARRTARFLEIIAQNWGLTPILGNFEIRMA
jgi:hypothetical protein